MHGDEHRPAAATLGWNVEKILLLGIAFQLAQRDAGRRLMGGFDRRVDRWRQR